MCVEAGRLGTENPIQIWSGLTRRDCQTGQMTFQCDLRGRDPKIRQPVIRSMLIYLPRAEVSSDFVDSNDPRQLREVCCWPRENRLKTGPKLALFRTRWRGVPRVQSQTMA